MISETRCNENEMYHTSIYWARQILELMREEKAWSTNDFIEKYNKEINEYLPMDFKKTNSKNKGINKNIRYTNLIVNAIIGLHKLGYIYRESYSKWLLTKSGKEVQKLDKIGDFRNLNNIKTFREETNKNITEALIDYLEKHKHMILRESRIRKNLIMKGYHVSALSILKILPKLGWFELPKEQQTGSKNGGVGKLYGYFPDRECQIVGNSSVFDVEYILKLRNKIQ